MVARLPIPGADANEWGDLLNDYLRQIHTENGQLKANVVTAVQLSPGSVTNPAVAGGSITENKLSKDVQDKLNALGSVTDGREVELRTNTTHLQWKYQDQSTWTNLIALTSLTGPQGDKGDDGQDGATGPQGDKGDPGDPATNLVTSVAGKQGVVTLDKSDVGLGNIDNTSDLNKPISTATQAALDGKQAAGSYAAATHTHSTAQVTGLDTALAAKASLTQPINAQTGTSYTLQASDVGKLVTLTNAGTITLTVPSGVFTAGQRVDCSQRGAGAVTVVGSGVTLRAMPGMTLVSKGQYAAWTILFISATEADAIGWMAAV